MTKIFRKCVVATMVLLVASVGLAEAKETKIKTKGKAAIAEVVIGTVSSILADGLKKSAKVIKEKTTVCKGSGSSGTAHTTSQAC